jgi:hypothetical protein
MAYYGWTNSHTFEITDFLATDKKTLLKSYLLLLENGEEGLREFVNTLEYPDFINLMKVDWEELSTFIMDIARGAI